MPISQATGDILVVDDEPAIRENFTAFLEAEGHGVVAVSDYDAAMAQLAARRFDLVLVDIILGGRTGMELLESVKANSPTTPVIVITGQPSLDTATESVRLGAFDYLMKPVRRRELVKAASLALGHKRLLDNKEQLERENRRWRAHHEAISRSIREAVVSLDLDGRITHVNPAVERLFGQPEGPAVGRTLHESWPGLPEAVHESWRSILNSGQPVSERQVEHRREDGSALIMELSGGALIDSEGRFLGAVLVIRDITRLVAMERELAGRSDFANIVGESDPMQELFRLLSILSERDTTVLITGESGTGKELVAEALHGGGPRAKGPLVRVNCSALSEGLLESELFGHVRGAFTGATSDKKGRFEMADGGTIFLDEIGDVSPLIQLKLLRVLQEQEFERVGDSSTRKVDVRIIAATNRDLAEAVASGSFREDLYYRLKVVALHLPPLRERTSDIPLLIEHFLARFNRKYGRGVGRVDAEAMRLLMRHRWPGNVRELKHAMEHAFVLCQDDAIGRAHLPSEVLDTPAPAPAPPRAALSSFDVRRALDEAQGKKAQAARLLGVSRQTLYRKLKEFGIAE